MSWYWLSPFEPRCARVLLAGRERAALYRRGGGLLYAADAAGRDALRRHLRAAPRDQAIHLLVDTAEEQLRSELLPRARGGDLRALIRRRQKKLFGGGDYFLCRRQGREPGAAGQHMLFACLGPGARPWAELLAECEAPLGGIHSVPLLLDALLKRLGLLREHRHLLLLSLHALAGVRQTYWRQGRLRFSRLIAPTAAAPAPGTPDTGTLDTGTPDMGTPDTGTAATGAPAPGVPSAETLSLETPSASAAPAGRAPANGPPKGPPNDWPDLPRLLEELRKVLRFVAAEEKDAGALHLAVLADPALLRTLGPRLPATKEIERRLLPLPQVARRLGLRAPESPYCDSLLAGCLLGARPGPGYAPRAAAYRLLCRDRAVLALGLAALAAGLPLAGALLAEGAALRRGAADMLARELQLQGRMAALRREMPAAPAPIEEMRRAVDAAAALQAGSALPWPLLRAVGGALDAVPELQLERIEWMARQSDAPAVEQELVLRLQKPRGNGTDAGARAGDGVSWLRALERLGERLRAAGDAPGWSVSPLLPTIETQAEQAPPVVRIVSAGGNNSGNNGDERR